MVSAINAGMIRLNNYRRLLRSVACGVFKESGSGRGSGLDSLCGSPQTKSVRLDLAERKVRAARPFSRS